MNDSQNLFSFYPYHFQNSYQNIILTSQYPNNQLKQLDPCNVYFDSSINYQGYIIDKDYLKSMRAEAMINIEDFEPLAENEFFNQIGHGAYSEVVLVRHKKTKGKYALKIIDKNKFSSPKQLEIFRREIDIHERLIHPNIIRLYGSIENETKFFLVLEYAENGSLFEYSRKKGKLSEKESIFFFIQAVRAIDFLHENNIIHRDLKPENLLLSQEFRQLKLSDFGWASEGSEKRKTFCGTMEYMAPEMLKSIEYSREIDVWAIGILLYELLHGHSPFKGNNDNETSKNIIFGGIRFLPYINQEIINLILKLLDRNNKSRIKAKEIFEIEIIKKYLSEFEKKNRHK